ncbi:MAG TPA: GNAT family N-acetyltransferase [Gaiellaceae bacterium]|nr:GNAT family N-acetyltransferase [Gaiellaceae bacterium]
MRTQDATDVILRDGSTLRLRPPVDADAPALLDFFSGLSERSRYLRFHGFPALGPALVEPVLDPDWDERGALLGTLGDGVVALANYARLRDRRAAEVAFTVDDAYQGRGIGTRLLEQLAAAAAEVGIEEFVAEVLPDNRNMLDVFLNAGFDVVRELESGSIEVRFPIAATPRYREQVAARDHVAVRASLRPFFEPACVAVVGASPRRGSIGGELFRNMLTSDFTGSVFPVNRKGDSVAGVRGYRSVSEIPDPLDLVVICLPGERVVAAADEALRAGVRALCVISAGFAEVGGEGRARQDELVALVRSHGARLVGPNCLGVAVPPIGMNATFAPRALPAGRIAVSSQSGALGLALLERARERGLGFSAFVSVGNKADVSSNDLLEWWEDDDATDLVVLYLESFGNPRKFGRLATRVARKKPILALKAGSTSTGAKAASSHTAALAGSETAVDALFRHAGVLRARTLEELVDAAVLLSHPPLPQGRRVAVVTNAGGLGILCADACDAAGLTLPELADETKAALSSVLPAESSVSNPVDLLGSATAETYAAALPIILADPGVDSVIAQFVPPVVAGADEVAEAMRAAAQGAPKPLLAVVVSEEGIPQSLRDADSPVAAFPYPESAAHALGLAAVRAEWLRRPVGTAARFDDLDEPAARSVVESVEDAWLEPAAVRALLSAYGIPLVPERVAADADEAVRCADALGYPVVLKTAAPGAHKTEVGGIALDLSTAGEVREAAERIGGPLLVQAMISGGAELLAGVVQDPVFGPLVAFGPGGTAAELIGGTTFAIAPLTETDADELVHSGKAGTLVRGFRGAPAADDAALRDLLGRLARLAEDLPAVAELDLNPVIALPTGCVAVDARVRVRRPQPTHDPKSW